MMTGLIIGKFMPLTKGHMGLIEFGLKNCDNLIVAVCTLKADPIDGDLRYKWVRKCYETNDRVEVVHIIEELPGGSESSREISMIWSSYLKERFPEANIVFASEKYGEYLAEYMGIQFRIFDISREIIPISATMIREDPYKYWQYIPDVVKPYYVKKICIYGPDSCGKSTLTIDLARYFNTSYVPEIARNMFEWSDLNIDNLNINQLEQFARLQSQSVKSMMYFADKVLFCDTDNLTTQIYSEVYCGYVTDEIKKYDDIDYEFYFLMETDTPYMEEGQRNLGHRRREMFQRFKSELDKKNRKYQIISGSWEERFKKAVDYVNECIFNK